MSEYVASRVETGQFGDASEYFGDLVRREQEQQNAVEELRRMLHEAEASGISGRKVPDIMRAVESDLRSNGQL